MSALRPEIDPLVRALIIHLTGFEDGWDENFDLCYDYAASNLLYHNFIDPPREKDVKNDIGGVVEKMGVHAEREKAKQLEDVVQKYEEAMKKEEKDHQQFDIRIRLLSLMWHLSNSCPPDADSTWKKELKSRQKASEDDYAENKEDWAAILAEGEQRWDGCGSGDDALSEWSGEEDLDDNDLEERKSDGRRRDDKKKPARMKLDERKDCCKKVNVDSAERRLRSAMQPEYWKEGGLTMPVPSRKETAHFVQLVDRAMEAQGAPVAVKTKLTEYQLLRECLWMVRRPPDKSTFAFRLGGDGRYTLRGDICLASVTAEALSRSLEYLLSFLSHLKEIMDFVDEVYANDSVSYTYEAYASCLADFLQLLSADLLRLETRVYKQEMTLTLFDLEKELTPWAKTVYALHACHRRSVVRPLDEQYCPNWRRAVKLLSGIFLCMHVTHNDTTHELILDLFLKSLVPYLRIIGLWLTEGRLEDYRDEFVFKQRAGTASAVEEEKFWKEGFEVRPYLEALAEDGLRLPSMLEKALPKILVGGKSIEILALLGKKNNRYGGPNLSDAVLCSREDLFRKFVENLKTELKMPKEPERGDAYTASSDRGNVAFFDSGIDECDDIDPYLKMAFEEVYKAAAEEGEASDVSTSVRSAFILPSSVDPLLPLTSVLERSLLPPVFDHYRLSCEALVRTVKETLSLDRHLGAVRRVFLMEAGDVLFEFYSELFGRMQDDGEAGAVEEAMLDSTSITLLLQDCVGRSYPVEADRFAISIPDSEDGSSRMRRGAEWLDRATLSYQVEWPLNFILDSASFKMYNEVFLFLLRVKRSIWTLQQISAKQLVESLEQSERQRIAERSDDDVEEEEDEDEKLDSDLLIHRILLLRSWLFHFVGNVHSYFMTRVLHSTEIELSNDLSAARDMDEIISAHSGYIGRIYDRCFLHPSVKVLREAVVKVLDLCQRLHGFCFFGQGRPDNKQLVAMEETYVRSHQFLASTLESMTTKRNVPHLDSLAAALVHSCPEKYKGAKQ